MKQARTGTLLPTVFLVVALGILHTLQKTGAALPSPTKDIVVVIGLLMVGAAVVYLRSARNDEESDEVATGDVEVVARNADDETTKPPVSLNEYDLSA